MSRQDALLIKEMNMNAVRSHYPPDEHFLDMCDSLGLVYIDELSGWHGRYDTETGARLIREMVERDVNHPSVILWSNGNEGGWNTDNDSLFCKYDKFQRRHVIHPWADFDGLDTHHYPAYLTGVARFTNGYKVFMPTEFMHAMYDQGGGAGLRDFWDRWMTNPMFAGGFIWVFCDEAPKRSDRGGVLDSDGSNAPDGVVGPRREKEGSFYAIRSQWSPVQIKPLLITEHFDGSFFVSNEYIYTNLKDCRMTYEVLSCDIPMQGAVSRILARGEVTLPALSPGETGKARFSLPASFAEGDVLKLEAFDRDGHRICDWSFPIRLANPYFQRHLAQLSTGLSGNTVSACNNGKEIVLKSEKVSVTFDATTGMILRVLSGNTEIPLTNGPVAVGMKMVYQPASSYVRQDSEEAVFVPATREEPIRLSGGLPLRDCFTWMRYC